MGAAANAIEAAGALARELGLGVGAEEVAALAEAAGMGEAEVAAIASFLGALSDRRRAAAVETVTRLSRLPRKAPKTFENFDFSRIQGRDAKALRELPSLANLYARRNIAFIGPCGVGKTHLAQAYGNACCALAMKTYYIKATELRDRLAAVAAGKRSTRAVDGLVKPSCLIVDEVGRCVFDRECTDLFFHVVDRRYEKEGPNTLILTSNTAPNRWSEFFTGDDSLLCTLDRIFDAASVYMIKGASYRGRDLETFSVEAAATAAKAAPVK